MKPLASNTLLQNRYLVVHLIGRGGMGEVYLAVDQRLGNPVALKRTVFFDDETLGSAFEREARILARLRHNVLPKVSDHFLEDGNQYLVMEYIAGDDLSKRLEIAKKPFPVDWVMFWADRLLDALDYLHSNEPPIIHRDIKPQNLKLTEDNQIVLLDFGLSKSTPDATRFSTTTAPSVVGYTPQYAPMEQIRGTGTDARSDVYSLCSTLYQLLTDAVPPDALTRADALLSEKTDPLQAISEINPQVSHDVSAIILKGMEISRDKRFARASEMQKLLRDAYAQAESGNRNSIQIVDDVVDSNLLPTVEERSLKTNVTSTTSVKAQNSQAEIQSKANAAGVSFNSPDLERRDSAARKPSSDSQLVSSARGNLDKDAFATAIPNRTEREISFNETTGDSRAIKNQPKKNSRFIFAGGAAILSIVTAIAFGFFVSNRSNPKTAVPETAVEAAPPPQPSAVEAATKPNEESRDSPREIVPGADESNESEVKTKGKIAENSTSAKTVQPTPLKTNQKPASESNFQKPAVKPPPRTAPQQRKPTPLPRILP